MFAQVKVGQKIRDNDPRETNRVLEIRHVEENRVVARSSMGKFFSIQRKRIYADGKPRKSGFTLVSEN